MAVMHVTRAIWLVLGIETENDLHDLTPIGALLIGVEQRR